MYGGCYLYNYGSIFFLESRELGFFIVVAKMVFRRCLFVKMDDS